MNKRKFLAGGAAAAGTAALAFPMVARSQAATINLRFQSTWPLKFIYHEFAMDWCKKASDLTGGRLKIEMLPAGAVVPGLQVIAPMANPACRAAFEMLIAHEAAAAGASPMRVVVLDGRAHEAMIAADAVLLASGTAALEAMLAKRPMVVAYRLATLTYRIVTGLRLLKVARYSLPNHLAGRDLVAEHMQEACTPASLAAALLPFLQARSVAPELLAEYERLHRLLGGDADRNAAAAVLD